MRLFKPIATLTERCFYYGNQGFLPNAYKVVVQVSYGRKISFAQLRENIKYIGVEILEGHLMPGHVHSGVRSRHAD